MKRLLLCLLLTGCTTTTITRPDGTIVKTSSADPLVVQAIANGVTQGALAGWSQQRLPNPKGFRK